VIQKEFGKPYQEFASMRRKPYGALLPICNSQFGPI